MMTEASLSTSPDQPADLATQRANQPLPSEFRTLADTIPALAWMAEADGSIFWYNQRWYDYTGTTLEEMAGWGWQKVHDPRSLQAVMERWTASLRTGEPFEMQFPLRRADGSFRSFLTRCTPFRDATGAITRWFGTNTEVEELETTRQTLADERSRLVAILDNVPIGLVFADTHGKIVGGNRQAERIFRHPVFLSETVGAYAEEWVSFHPDGRRVEGHEFPLALALADGQVHSGEFLHRCGDGSHKWVVFTGAPIRDADGNVIGGVVATLDIDARKRAQDELRLKTAEAERQHAEIETLYSTAPIGLALFDVQDYRYLRLNERQAAFFGLRPDDIVGQTVTQLAPIPGLQELFDGVRAGTPVIDHALEGELATDPGNHRHWTVSYYPVHAPDGSVQAIAAASLEITQQKKAEAALVQNEKLAAVGRLAASIAHEINNPLESVTNLLYLAHHSDSLREAKQYIATAEVELRRAAAITNQTLRFHRQATNPTEVTCQAIFTSVLDFVQSRLLNSRIQLEKRLRAQRGVLCFEGEVRQVVTNLINNAVDAMPDGGRLLVRSREGHNWATGELGIVLTVADTGTGIPPASLAKLFQAFYTTKGIGGTGLGLWISQEIVARHNGAMRVRSSQRPGSRGTVFTLFLPFDAVTRPPAA